jgi:hypothetical protein
MTLFRDPGIADPSLGNLVANHIYELLTPRFIDR